MLSINRVFTWVDAWWHLEACIWGSLESSDGQWLGRRQRRKSWLSLYRSTVWNHSSSKIAVAWKNIEPLSTLEMSLSVCLSVKIRCWSRVSSSVTLHLNFWDRSLTEAASYLLNTLACKQALEILLSLAPQWQHFLPWLAFYVGVRDLNSGSHAYTSLFPLSYPQPQQKIVTASCQS